MSGTLRVDPGAAQLAAFSTLPPQAFDSDSKA